MSKILRGIYESEFNFDKLYDFLRHQADLCENITKVNRFECRYFLVGFYGKKFPKLFQNRRFVFRSEPLEQIITFRQRVESWFPNSIRISHSYPVTELEYNSPNQFIQVINVYPISQPNEAFKVTPKLIKYYEHNEVKKFKYSYRKDSVLNEDDPTMWWLVEKHIIISNPLPSVINFYDVVDEKSINISPIKNAINIVRERLDMLKESFNKIETKNEVSEADKLLIQGTIDPGVLGGLPKYKKFFQDYDKKEELNIQLLNELIKDTIYWGECLLESALYYLPTDHLLNILKKEQLPKLKILFNIQTKNIKEENNTVIQLRSCESTPKMCSKSSLNEPNNLNKSLLNKVQENYTGRTILSYFGVCEKPSSSNFQTMSDNSNRESMSSIKSINSEEDSYNKKIILDETISSKRPLRRFQNMSSISSNINSYQSSRPISNLSNDEQNAFTNIYEFDKKDKSKLNEENIVPPKPPKTSNINFQISKEFLNKTSVTKSININDQSKSTTSLNYLPFKNNISKTNSDSVLNTVFFKNN